jgi:hypothetical protein
MTTTVEKETKKCMMHDCDKRATHVVKLNATFRTLYVCEEHSDRSNFLSQDIDIHRIDEKSYTFEEFEKVHPPSYLPTRIAKSGDYRCSYCGYVFEGALHGQDLEDAFNTMSDKELFARLKRSIYVSMGVTIENRDGTTYHRDPRVMCGKCSKLTGMEPDSFTWYGFGIKGGYVE